MVKHDPSSFFSADPNCLGFLQVLSLTLFEKLPLEQLLGNNHYRTHIHENAKLLNLFYNLTGH